MPQKVRNEPGLIRADSKAILSINGDALKTYKRKREMAREREVREQRLEKNIDKIISTLEKFNERLDALEGKN